MEVNDWSCLPEHIVVEIMMHLPLPDRYHLSTVCRAYQACFQSPYVWKSFHCFFFLESHKRFINCITNFGESIQSLDIELDQFHGYNRDNSIKVLENIENVKNRRLQKLCITFRGENPYFYAGKEYIIALKKVFGPPKDDVKIINPLKEVDLSGLTVMFDDAFIDVLSKNNPHLEKVNIQNKVLICKVSPSVMFNMAHRCRKLRQLSVLHYSVTEEVLLAFTEKDRTPLSKLSLYCRREEKYRKDISEACWKIVREKLPDLRVSIKFDHNCPLNRIQEILCPSTPIQEIRYETFTCIDEEVRTATRYYKNTLEKVVIHTPSSRNSPQFNSALVELATECKLLKSLHVYCVVAENTVEEILRLLPAMKDSQDYTLKSTPEPAPWVAGKAALEKI